MIGGSPHRPRRPDSELQRYSEARVVNMLTTDGLRLELTCGVGASSSPRLASDSGPERSAAHATSLSSTKPELGTLVTDLHESTLVSAHPMVLHFPA
jgi:hypothetical protein